MLHNGPVLSLDIYTQRLSERCSQYWNFKMDRTIDESVQKENGESRDQRDVPKKPVTLSRAVSLIVGSIIGSGIFISPEGVLEQSGSVGSALLIWLAAGIISTLGAFSFAELGTTYPKCGGVYKYLKEMFGPLPSFVTLWTFILVTDPAVAAILSRTLANSVLAPFYDNCKPPPLAVSLLAAWTLSFEFCSSVTCILLNVTNQDGFSDLKQCHLYEVHNRTYCLQGLPAMTNCYSKVLVLRVQTALAFTKVTVLVIIISLGMWTLGTGHTDNLKEPFSDGNDAKGVAFALYSALFAYGGWGAINAVVGQLENPQRNLPLAIGLSLPLVMFVYVLVNLAYVVVLPYESLIASTSVAVSFGQHYAYWLAWVIPACIALSVYGTLNGRTYAKAMVVQASAREGHFPLFGSMVHRKRKTLIPVFVLQCALGIIYVNFETFTLMSTFSFVARSTDALCVVGLILYRYKQPELKRPFRNPIVVPVLYACALLFLAIVTAIGEPTKTLTGLAVVGLGIPAYFLTDRGIHVKFCEAFMRKLNLFFIGVAELSFDTETE